ncbi:MAG: FAD-dependent oxidoreductase, partial [Caulobacteraceae bacterium]
EQNVRACGIDCDFRRVPGFLVAALGSDPAKEITSLQEDARLAAELGFDAIYLDAVPGLNRPGFRIANQAKFHVGKYLAGLAEVLVRSGVSVFEGSEVNEFNSDPKRLMVNGHNVRCSHVVMATHYLQSGFESALSRDLLQTKIADEIRAWVDSKTDWQPLAKSIAYKHLDEGLIDRGITRDLAWGIPVTKDGFPRPGMEDKVFYVWFDAPIEYIGATEEWAGRTGATWRDWWRLDEGADDVRYVQFMGKDNVAFHTVSFPATIIGSGEPWKTVDQLKAFNWLNWYGGKFSTSQKRGVFMDQALELLPADYWRWHLTAYGPEHSDAAFTWEQFQSTTNKDLADVLGNFVNRIVKFAESKFDGVAPDGGEPGELEAKLEADIRAGIAEATAQFEAMEFRKAAQALRAVWVLGNEYLQVAAPWTALKTDRDRAAVGVRTGLNLVALFARLAAPVMPFTAEKIAATVGSRDLTWPDAEASLFDRVPAGQAVASAEVLFKKIEDAQVAEWSERFGGAE